MGLYPTGVVSLQETRACFYLFFLPPEAHRESYLRTQAEGSSLQVRKKASLGTESTSTLSWDFQLPELWEGTFLLVKLPVCCALSWKPEFTTQSFIPTSTQKSHLKSFLVLICNISYLSNIHLIWPVKRKKSSTSAKSEALNFLRKTLNPQAPLQTHLKNKTIKPACKIILKEKNIKASFLSI